MRLSSRPLVALAALIVTATIGSPALAASQSAKVSAKVLKPLTISWVQDLNLGIVMLSPGTWTGATVGISRTGALTCTSPRVTCSGAAQVARYRVTGSNSQPVRISAPNVTLTKQGDPTKTLTLAVDSPGTINLPNSGNQGVIFPLGGSITLNSGTSDGVYSGTFNVTVDY